MGNEAMTEAVNLIKQGVAPRVPQDESKATYEPPCDDRVASIDSSKPVNEVYNLIRGCDPQPGAFIMYRGKRIRFYDTRKKSLPAKEGAGQVVAIERGGIEIAVQGGVITVGKLRVDKGEKMGPIEFTQSVGVKVGDRFGN